MMLDRHYVEPDLAALYDLDSGWSADRDFYLSLADRPGERILDLGCGTGLLCDAYAARGHDVTGVDPAPAMLDVARRKPHGPAVEWVTASAQTYRSDKRFDLITMTGHAFQVMLDDRDVAAALSTMRRHLAPGGRIVFESRNPAIDWPARWDYDIVMDGPEGTVHEAQHVVAMDGEFMTFELRYRFPDRTLVSTSRLRFLSLEAISRHLTTAGLQIDHVLGDWDGNPFEDGTSEEIIILAGATRASAGAAPP